MPIAFPVVGRRTADAVSGQPFGDGVDTEPGEELGEDPLDHGGGFRVDAQGRAAACRQRLSLGWGAARAVAGRDPLTDRRSE